jgi:hypothetical protein
MEKQKNNDRYEAHEIEHEHACNDVPPIDWRLYRKLYEDFRHPCNEKRT